MATSIAIKSFSRCDWVFLLWRKRTTNGIGARVACKLNYVDYNSETAIIIKAFNIDDIHLYYAAWRDEKRYKHCTKCGCIIILNSNAMKYCNSCYKEIEQAMKNEYKKTHL